jgi:hypothetical protein
VTVEPEYLSDEQVVDIIEYPDDHCSHCGPVASELLARRKQEAAIRALHHQVPSFDEYLESESWCDDCTTEWPCPTIRILDGEPS